jgi:hypothetical protein
MKHQYGQAFPLLIFALLFTIAHADAEQPRDAPMSNLAKLIRLRRGVPCPVSTMCRSQWGYCGNSAAYCGDGCQAGPCRSATSTTKMTTRPTTTGVTNTDKEIITADRFRCVFGNLNDTTRSARLDGLQRSDWKPQNADEAAVFLAHVYHETDGLKTLTEYCAPSKFRRRAVYVSLRRSCFLLCDRLQFGLFSIVV